MSSDSVDFATHVINKIIDYFEDIRTQANWSKNHIAVQIRSLYIEILHEELKKKDKHE